MEKEDFQKMWRHWLLDIGLTGADIAKEHGLSQQALNTKIRNATIKYTELAEIVARHGYIIDIRKA